MLIRNLSLFLTDDRPVSGFLHSLFEVNPTPYGWEQHCLDAASNKQLTFDLLSSDINYSEDRSDPDWSPRLEGKFTSWGLVHAVTALARRKPTDDEGNWMPFEWEIRSVTPAQVRDDTWGLRIYGLLRSLAAQPRENEALSACIIREHKERHDETLETTAFEDGICSYGMLFADDIAAQTSKDSSLEDITGRMLPRWRAKLIHAVKNGHVRLHLKTLENCVKHLKSRQKSGQWINANDPDDRNLCIPFSTGATGNFAYGINAFSVFGDLFSREHADAASQFRLKTDQVFPALRVDDPDCAGPLSVLEWFDHLRTLVVGMQTSTPREHLMLGVADRLEECLRAQDPEAQVEALNALIVMYQGDYTRMGMLFLLLVARRQLSGSPHSRSADLKKAYHHPNIEAHTFSRPILYRGSVFPQLGGPDALGRELCNALEGRSHLLGAFWSEWIRKGLELWYDKYKARVDPNGNKLGKYASGLRECGDLARQG